VEKKSRKHERYHTASSTCRNWTSHSRIRRCRQTSVRPMEVGAGAAAHRLWGRQRRDDDGGGNSSATTMVVATTAGSTSMGATTVGPR